MTAPLMRTDEDKTAEVIFNVYPGKNGAFAFYEDGGDGYGYEKGEYTVTEIKWNNSERALTVPENFRRPYKTVIHD